MNRLLMERIQRRASDASVATDNGAEFGCVPDAPLDVELISQAERTLGRALPPLLRDAYRLIGNGGFGPGYGLLPLVSTPPSDDSESALSLYLAFRSDDPEDPQWHWPEGLMPLCDWGCAIRSCIDLSSLDAAIVTFDPHPRAIGEPMASSFAVTHDSLDAWFSDWVDGVKIWDLMFEPDPSKTRVGINPFTKEPISIVPNKLRRRDPAV